MNFEYINFTETDRVWKKNIRLYNINYIDIIVQYFSTWIFLEKAALLYINASI